MFYKLWHGISNTFWHKVKTQTLMKTSINKLFAALLVAIVFTAGSVLANGNNPSESSSVHDECLYQLSEQDIQEILISLEDDGPAWLNETITYQIFDAEDNLIMEKEIARDAPLNDSQLVTLLAKSDLIMNYNNTSYYRLSEH